MKRILSVLACAVLLLTLFNFPSPASADSSYNEDGVLALMKELKILNGDSSGNYRLDDRVSRAEFTKMIINASEYKNSVALNQPTSTFKDVKYTHWAAPYIRTGATKGLITGYSDATFRPDSNVLLEEALNISLKLLGYTSEDFGSSWPSGQIGLSENIGLTKNVSASAGSAITRRDAMNIIYNMLNTHTKNTNTYYITKLNYELSEDVILIASSNEDTSVGSDKIYTSAGTYKVSDLFNYRDIGKKGTLIIKSGNEAAAFVPDSQQSAQYNIYQILNDSVIVIKDGTMSDLGVSSDLTVYYKSQKYTLSSLSGVVSTGDVITVYKNEKGIVDYGIISSDSLTGPYTVYSENWLSLIGMSSDASVMRNGSKSDTSSVRINDVVYYSKTLNTIWAYSKKITGIYESAYPTKDNPTSVTISGTSYKIEGTDAYAKLSSGGSCEIGDTVTILLGRDGTSVADVLSPSSSADYASVYGYVTETGTKQYSDSTGNPYNSYYIKVIDSAANELEYPTEYNYEEYKNSVVKITIRSQGVSAARINSYSNVSGVVNSSAMTIGKSKYAADINILDVAETGANGASAYKKVYPKNMDGITISSKYVLYSAKNSSGEITDLILQNVSGDVYEYGIVTKAPGSSAAGGMYSYTVDTGKATYSVTSSANYKIYVGNAVRLIPDGNGFDSVKSLGSAISGITSLTETSLTASKKEYKISPDVSVFKKTGLYTYHAISLSELVENASEYKVTAYANASAQSGGKIRVIVAE